MYIPSSLLSLLLCRVSPSPLFVFHFASEQPRFRLLDAMSDDHRRQRASSPTPHATRLRPLLIIVYIRVPRDRLKTEPDHGTWQSTHTRSTCVPRSTFGARLTLALARIRPSTFYPCAMVLPLFPSVAPERSTSPPSRSERRRCPGPRNAPATSAQRRIPNRRSSLASSTYSRSSVVSLCARWCLLKLCFSVPSIKFTTVEMM